MNELDVFWSLTNSIYNIPKINLAGVEFYVAMNVAKNVEESLIKTIKEIHIPLVDGLESLSEIRKPSMVLLLIQSMFDGVNLLGDLSK